MEPRKVTVIGTGYVGLVTAACLAEVGHQVCGLDTDALKIAALQQGTIPIHEPGLEPLVRRNLGVRLWFTSSYAEAIPWAEILLVAVGTPPDSSGDPDLSAFWNVAEALVPYINSHKVVAVKSTVPVGTCDELERVLHDRLRSVGHSQPARLVTVVSNPEFLREGRAVDDFLKADRVVIGGNDPGAMGAVRDLYEPLGVPIVVCDRRSAEMVKYASNAFLATKISFINSIARLCERLGADVVKVAEGMGYDHRIMPEHLRAGLGYGGSCFPKDCAALLRMAERVGFDFKLLRATVEVNQGQVEWVVEQLARILGHLEGSVVAVWGLAFKPNTDDTREAPALRLIEALTLRGAVVRAYDPVARLPETLNGIVRCMSAYEAARGADAVVLATEWPEFACLDFREVKAIMRGNLLIDGRNCLEPSVVRRLGFQYMGVGRGSINQLPPKEIVAATTGKAAAGVCHGARAR